MARLPMESADLKTNPATSLKADFSKMQKGIVVLRDNLVKAAHDDP
jgi:hypothetical protein